MFNRKIATTTIVTLSQNHKGLLQEAVQQGVALGETVEIITESFDKIQFNKKLLMVFSQSLRNCMAEIPCCSTPHISMPSITASSLVKVQKFLLKTINNDDSIDFNDEDVEEIVKAAETLGIDIVLVRKPSRNIKPHDVVERPDEPVTQQEVHDVVELPDEPVTQQEVHDVVELPDEPVTQQEVIDTSSAPMREEEEEAASEDVAKMVGSSSESELLDGDGDISSDEESLQEESERMKNNDTEEEESETEPASLMSCKICGKDRKRPTPLKEHYTTHFFKELFDKFVASNKSHSLCSFDGCNKNYGDKKRLVRHIGSTHNKVIEILKREGLPVPMAIQGGQKRRHSEKLERSDKRIKTENGDEANKSLDEREKKEEEEEKERAKQVALRNKFIKINSLVKKIQ